MAVEQLLGFKDFFQGDVPGTKEDYAGKVGKADIQKLCCLLLTYCKKGAIPSVDNMIRMWFQYKGKSYLDSAAYHYVQGVYMNLVRTSGHNQYYILSEESLLNLYIWATENKNIPQSIDHKDGAFMVPLFMLYLLFNEDVLANFDMALQSAKKHPDKVLMRMILAQRFPQNDLVDIDYGKLVYTQTYKLMQLLNYLEATPKYQPLFHHLLQDFDCAGKEEFFKALGGAVVVPLNPNKTGINNLVLDPLINPNKSGTFLNKLVFDAGDVNLGPTDYKMLRNRPLQKDGDEYRVVFDLFLIKKLYNGICFKLSEYVNKNPALLKGNFFGEIRNDFSEGVLLYNTMNEILAGSPGKKITGNEFKEVLQREPDYYYREELQALLMESKDFFMVAKDKLSYDFDVITKGLWDGRLGKGVLQSATNAIRALKQDLILDKDYDPSKLAIYPVIVVHDSLYDTPALNYWVNEWFQEALVSLLAKPENASLDISGIRPLVLVDIDTIILYKTNFQKGELNLFKLLEGYQVLVDFNKLPEPADAHYQNAIIPFALYVEKEAGQRGITIDLKLIQDIYQASGYLDIH